MKRVLVDANVFLHALGSDPELRPACEHVIAKLAGGELAGEAAALMIEEVAHVRHRRTGDPARAVKDGRAAAAVVVALHSVGEPELDAALDVFQAHQGLSARDAVHVAVARRHDLVTVLTTDRAFDEVEGLHRVDPGDRDAFDELVA